MSDNLIIKSSIPSFEIPLISFGEFMWKRLLELDDKSICIIEGKSGSKLTFKELISQANSIAVALLNRGITKSDRICCYSKNSIQYAILIFASYFLGITFVPISPTIAAYELKYIMRDMGSVVIFTSVANAQHFDQIIKDSVNQTEENLKIKSLFVLNGSYSNDITFDQLLEEGKNEKLNRIPHFDIDPKNDIFVIFRSSGTTGLPKAPIHSHYSFVATILEFYKTMPSNSYITSLIAPFGHSGGSMLLPYFFYLGATVIIYEEYDEELILKSVEKYRINYFSIFPAFGWKLIEGELADKYDFSSVKLIATGGAAFPTKVAKAIIDKYNITFVEAYGLTEFFAVSWTPFTEASSTEYIPGSVGRVSPNTQLKVIDLTTGHSLGPNIDGEICVRGPKMFSGYLNNISATNDTIDSEGWLHTGDIGHYDQNENLFITDRLKEVIKFGAFPVCPIEIEQFLLTHESVAEVAVVGVKHETQSQWPRAYVKVKEGKSVTEEELKKYVSETLGYTKHLRAGVIFVDEIPGSRIGKIERKYFKQLVINEVIKRQ